MVTPEGFDNAAQTMSARGFQRVSNSSVASRSMPSGPVIGSGNTRAPATLKTSSMP
ncbi:hypothetical protein CfE428DRAFT_2968 [Chthoniobacter flavus Ellin428]|uniref:Uncharacterized protein n=1 Tax=Chthoniobacter flavus Ellin428 TaxID=497964 RepID=B4D243_9BACT|nr:hypothetical protein CfE428DRAFT_2968 [Chthoniobacter flavus Ellin428]